MTITIARIISGIFGVASGTNANGGTSNLPVDSTETQTLTNGSGSLKATKIYSAEITLGSGENFPVDVQNLTDAFGSALSFSTIKAIWIKNTGSDSVTIDSILTIIPLSDFTLASGQHLQSLSPDTDKSVGSITKTIDLTAGSAGTTVGLVIVGN